MQPSASFPGVGKGLGMGLGTVWSFTSRRGVASLGKLVVLLSNGGWIKSYTLHLRMHTNSWMTHPPPPCISTCTTDHTLYITDHRWIKRFLLSWQESYYTTCVLTVILQLSHKLQLSTLLAHLVQP